MKKEDHDKHGATPLPKGKRHQGTPLFKKPRRSEEEKKDRDRTGQTDTSLKHMKQRLAEVPKRSAGSEHDKKEFEDK